MNYEQLIEDRKSIRNFYRKDVTSEEIDELTKFFDTAERLIPDLKVQMEIKTGIASRMEGVVGYRGYAFNAPAYMVIYSEENPGMYLNAGFIAENMSLKMVDMSLENCWLTISDTSATKRALLTDTDLTPVVIFAFGQGRDEDDETRIDINTMSDVDISRREGHVAPKISLQEMAYDTTWGSTVADWTSDEVDPVLAKGLYAASLAPSLLNRQPYRYLFNGKYLYLLATKDDITPEVDQQLNLGATMFNFRSVYSNYNHMSRNWMLTDLDVPADAGVPAEYHAIAKYIMW